MSENPSRHWPKYQWEEIYNDTDGGIWVTARKVNIDAAPHSRPGRGGVTKLPFLWFVRTTLAESSWVVEVGLAPTEAALTEKMKAGLIQSFGGDEPCVIDPGSIIMYGYSVPVVSAQKSWDPDDEYRDDWDDEAPLTEAFQQAKEALPKLAPLLANEAMARPVNRMGQDGWSYLYEDVRSFLRRAPETEERKVLQTMYGGLNGTVTVMKHSDLLKCRFTIVDPSHYRPDGSCRCDDEWHRKMMIASWGYTPKSFKGIPLREEE